jgi:hypothetical protein
MIVETEDGRSEEQLVPRGSGAVVHPSGVLLIASHVLDVSDLEEQADSAESREPGYSQGIGQSRDDWEAIHGEPNPEFSISEDYVYYGVRNNDMTVMYINGNIHSILGVTPNLQVSDSEAFLLGFSPDDAVFLEPYTAVGGQITNEYYSESLIPRIKETFWHNAEPGVFITGYHVAPETGLAESWLVATGNNP